MLSLQDVPEGSKKDIAFQMIVAMRDTLNIAKKRGNKPTYENAIRLFHDFSPELYQDIIGSDDFYVDYDLKHGKYLRIRLLHPDEAEHITGADLVYEQHNEKTRQIRILFLQYKIWEDGVIYYSKAKNLEAQLRKLESVL